MMMIISFNYVEILEIILITSWYFIFLFIFVIISNRIEDKIQKKKYAKHGIKNRYVTMSYCFCLYKIKDNEKYYLNCDDNFYTTRTNVREYKFDTIEEKDNYIKDNIERIKSKYGEDIHIQKYIRHICIGYCKKLGD